MTARASLQNEGTAAQLMVRMVCGTSEDCVDAAAAERTGEMTDGHQDGACGMVPEWAMVEFQGELQGMREAAASAPQDTWEWERGGTVTIGKICCSALDPASVRFFTRDTPVPG